MRSGRRARSSQRSPSPRFLVMDGTGRKPCSGFARMNAAPVATVSHSRANPQRGAPTDLWWSTRRRSARTNGHRGARLSSRRWNSAPTDIRSSTRAGARLLPRRAARPVRPGCSCPVDGDSRRPRGRARPGSSTPPRERPRQSPIEWLRGRRAQLPCLNLGRRGRRL
jgi:hypothetical protein